MQSSYVHGAHDVPLIAEIVLTSAGIADSRSLPVRNAHSMVAFRNTSEAYVKTGTVLNFGLASAKFGGSGGGFQAEFVSGPPIIFTPLHGKEWHSIAGNA